MSDTAERATRRDLTPLERRQVAAVERAVAQAEAAHLTAIDARADLFIMLTEDGVTQADIAEVIDSSPTAVWATMKKRRARLG